MNPIKVPKLVYADNKCYEIISVVNCSICKGSGKVEVFLEGTGIKYTVNCLNCDGTGQVQVWREKGF